jgi:integrase
VKKNKQVKVHVLDKGRECWYMRFRDPVTGKDVVRSTEVPMDGGSAKSKKAAEKEAAKWEADLQEGRYKPPSRVTWVEFRQRYEDEVVPGLAENTAGKVSAAFNAVEEHLGVVMLADLDAGAISRLTQKLREAEWNKDTLAKKAKRAGKKLERGCKATARVGVAEATIKGTLAYLLAALRWSKRLKMLAEVPEVDTPKRAKKSSRTTPMKGRPLLVEEHERMLMATPAVVGEGLPDERMQHLLKGLWWSGLRLGEALNLSWDDDRCLCVDLSGEFPMLRIRAELEKGNEDRLLPIAPEFVDFLLTTPQAARTGYVFNPVGSRSGERPSLDWVSKVVAKIGKKAGVRVNSDGRTGKPKFASAHDYRRSFGERWAARVMPPILQQLMRHESIDTTLRFYVGQNAKNAATVVWESVGRQLGDTLGDSSDFASQGHTARTVTNSNHARH